MAGERVMFKIPTDQKKLKSLISRYKSEMKREEKEHGFLSDGAGKRYILFFLYFILNDSAKSLDYIKWYEEKCPNDVGDPIQKLCWVLMLYRAGEQYEARVRAADLMLSNLYMIPFVLGRDTRIHRIWYGSNLEERDFVSNTPAEILNSIGNEERDWLASVYDDPLFVQLRKKHIELMRKVKKLDVGKERTKLLGEARSLLKDMQFS